MPVSVAHFLRYRKQLITQLVSQWIRIIWYYTQLHFPRLLPDPPPSSCRHYSAIIQYHNKTMPPASWLSPVPRRTHKTATCMYVNNTNESIDRKKISNRNNKNKKIGPTAWKLRSYTQLQLNLNNTARERETERSCFWVLSNKVPIIPNLVKTTEVTSAVHVCGVFSFFQIEYLG